MGLFGDIGNAFSSAAKSVAHVATAGAKDVAHVAVAGAKDVAKVATTGAKDAVKGAEWVGKKVVEGAKAAASDAVKGAKVVGKALATGLEKGTTLVENHMPQWARSTLYSGERGLLHGVTHLIDKFEGNVPTKVDAKGVHANPQPLDSSSGGKYVKDTTPLFAPGGPSASDIHQHGVEDCYFDSVLGAVAKTDPQLIKKNIHDNGDGTVTVHLGGKDVTVSRELPVDGNGNPTGVSGSNSSASKPYGDSSWAAYYEKAYVASTVGKYSAVEGGKGFPSDVYKLITGNSPTLKAQPKDLAAALQQSINAGNAPVATSSYFSDDTANDVHKAHVYMVTGTETINGTKYIDLKNPWGVEDPKPLTEAQFKKDFHDVEDKNSVYVLDGDPLTALVP